MKIEIQDFGQFIDNYKKMDKKSCFSPVCKPNKFYSVYLIECTRYTFSGANTGIGKETALDLAKKGARVILLCRSLEKAKKAVEDIKKQVAAAQLTVHQLDLASLKSVRNCAQTLIDTEDRIDILVNNAGKKNF